MTVLRTPQRRCCSSPPGTGAPPMTGSKSNAFVFAEHNSAGKTHRSHCESVMQRHSHNLSIHTVTQKKTETPPQTLSLSSRWTRSMCPEEGRCKLGGCCVADNVRPTEESRWNAATKLSVPVECTYQGQRVPYIPSVQRGRCPGQSAVTSQKTRRGTTLLFLDITVELLRQQNSRSCHTTGSN